jgi:hypothetical protein
MGLFAAQRVDTEHNSIACHYAECHDFFVVPNIVALTMLLCLHCFGLAALFPGLSIIRLFVSKEPRQIGTTLISAVTYASVNFALHWRKLLVKM